LSGASPAHVLRRVFAPALLLAIFLLLPVYLAAPVPRPLFRLHVATQFVHLRCEAAKVVSIRASDWELSGASEGGSAKTVTSRSSGPSVAGAFDLISIDLQPGDQIEIRQLAAGKPRYTIALPARSLKVSVQLHEQSFLVRKDAKGVESVDSELGSVAVFEALARSGALLRFSVAPANEDVVEHLNVNRLGFGMLESDEVLAGLLAGQLQFLDKPDSELKLFRGADLRFGDYLDAEISAIALSDRGIRLDAQGRTNDAYLQVTLRGGEHRVRNMLPTRFEAMQGDPVVVVLVAFVAALAGAAGLFLSVAQTVPSVGKWLIDLRKLP